MRSADSALKSVVTGPTKASHLKPNEYKEAPSSRAKSDVPLSNSFDVLNKIAEEDIVEANMALISNPASSSRDFKFGELGKSDEDEVFEPDDVYDLPGQMQDFCDRFDILVNSCAGK
nr:hypothetical protein [Tanacetum cinerariifolium]